MGSRVILTMKEPGASGLDPRHGAAAPFTLIPLDPISTVKSTEMRH